jgi:uncharacterized membrane protein YfcA
MLPFDQPLLLVLVATVFMFGGFVKGVIGLGLPTITMGVLSVALPPAQAAALLVVPSLLTNVWQAGGPGTAALAKRLAPMLVALCAGIAIGAGWLSAASEASSVRASGALGAALVVYAASGLLRWRPHVTSPHEAWLGPLAGLATGLVTAATGVFVIPAVPYLQALGLARDELVRALGLAFLVATVALGLALRGHGALPLAMAAASLLAVAPALLGMAFGQALRRHIAPEPFRRLFLAALLALGAYLGARALLQA